MLANLVLYLANAKKAIIQVCTFVLGVGAVLLTFQTSLPSSWGAGITVAVGIAGAVLHYLATNAPAPGSVEAEETDDIPLTPVLRDANGEAVPNEDPEEDELDEGPVVDEIPVLPSKSLSPAPS